MPFVFEHRTQKLLPRHQFLKRLLKFFCAASVLVAGALGLGILGYHYICGMTWIDALLNASMILTGMGPVNPLQTSQAKVFASGYALFSGIVFLSAASLVIAPVFHRLLHRFHLAEEDLEKAAGSPDKRSK